MKRLILAAVAAAFYFIAVPSVFAGGDLSGFDSAINRAIVNIPDNTDVAGWGGADVGTPTDFSSRNAAVLGAATDLKFGFSGTCGYVAGIEGKFCGASATTKLPFGVLQLAYAGGESNSSFVPETGVDFKLNHTNSISLLYGMKVAEKVFGSEDKVYVGFGITPYSETKSTFAVEGMNFLQASNKAYAVNAGVHYENGKLNAGAFYEYTRNTTTVTDVMAEESFKEKSTDHQFRAGASYKILDGLTAIVNYQYLNLGGNISNQIFGGAEVCPIESVCGYVGHNGSGLTGGIGIYPSDNWGINLAYVDNADRKLRDQIGKKPSVTMLSLYYIFEDKK